MMIIFVFIITMANATSMGVCMVPVKVNRSSVQIHLTSGLFISRGQAASNLFISL